SDIDLLVLLAHEPQSAERESLERLIGTLWDIGLEIGHSVRTVEGCLSAAADDVTVRTTLLEARFLAGSRALLRRLEHALARSLARHEVLLQDLRIRLHYLAGRREDRLVFDVQTALATQLGYADSAHRRASEAMMQRYYQTAKGVTQLNTILLQNLGARLVP